mmetsp:Transcript_10190/g.22967  ORF Transcript_10190/g.22967 Transcript_10190/m.22967 type:complete len:251 (+) Transcript_10190:88-840(+)
MKPLAPSDLYPALRQFLSESGLQKTLKAFDKETELSNDAVEGRKVRKGAVGRALKELEILAACQACVEAKCSGEAAQGLNGHAVQSQSPVEETQAAAEEAVEAVEPPKKKRKREEVPEADTAAGEGAAQEEAEEAPAEAELSQKKAKNKKTAKGANNDDKPKSGVPFSRVDQEKWRSAVQDGRFLDNTHEAKKRFGGGDSWGDSASADLLKVKGKGFRKEMAKKKRASWRGSGEINQGVNSVLFPDSDDE